MLFEILGTDYGCSSVKVLKRCLNEIFEFDELFELLMLKRVLGREDVLLLCLYRLVNAPGQGRPIRQLLPAFARKHVDQLLRIPLKHRNERKMKINITSGTINMSQARKPSSEVDLSTEDLPL